MSTISPASYYQLTNLLSNATSGSTSGSTAGSGTASLAQSLAQALDGSSGSGSSGSGDAYLLDLSPSAQSLLGGSSSSSGSSSSTFTLSATQEKQIEAIIAKYKNAPYDQATFDSIQKDLESAGLGADQLSAKDLITSFNPTDTLLSALSGNYTSLSTPSTNESDEATKANNYMESILSDWKSVSTTASASSASGSAATSVSA